MGIVPESAAQSARREATARLAARRQAARMLAIVECTARYGASQLRDGISPAEARQVALFVADELDVVAACLRRLARLDPAERRVLARRLNGLGLTRQQIAARLDVSEQVVRDYLRPVVRAGETG